MKVRTMALRNGDPADTLGNLTWAHHVHAIHCTLNPHPLNQFILKLKSALYIPSHVPNARSERPGISSHAIHWNNLPPPPPSPTPFRIRLT